MSNIAYRVILERPLYEIGFIQFLTWTFVGLFLLAAGLAAWAAFFRKEQPTLAVQDFGKKTFGITLREMIHGYHKNWKDYQATEINHIWCDRPYVEEYIADLKAAGHGPKFDAVKREINRSGFSAIFTIPFIQQKVTVFDREVTRELVKEPREVSDVVRLGNLIRYLVNNDLLSSITGELLGYGALNQVSNQVLSRELPPGVASIDLADQDILNPDNPLVLNLMTQNINDTLDKGEHKISLFGKTWQMKENGSSYVLTYKKRLPFAMEITKEGATVKGLIFEFNVPRDANLDQNYKEGFSTRRLDAGNLE